jgi:DNA polymerase III alpha subunit
MIHLALQTEFSFKQCFGHTDEVVRTAAEQGCSAVGIADVNNTFGFVQFRKACKKYGVKPIYGARIFVTADKESRLCHLPHIFVALNSDGLKEIYRLVSQAWSNFHYIPRLYQTDLREALSEPLGYVLIAPPYTPIPLGAKSRPTPDLGGFPVGFRGVLPGARLRGPEILPEIAVITNRYPSVIDREVYQLMAGRTKRGETYFSNFEDSVNPQHILTQDECRYYFTEEQIANTYKLAEQCDVDLPTASMARFPIRKVPKKKPETPMEVIDRLCKERAEKLGILGILLNVESDKYNTRYKYEMSLIEKKDYADYFLIVSDMIQFAKKQMLVGPARGSSAGSLVCYLLRITEIDPIEHGLLFERFIDLNRIDLPDIDVDFPDRKRKIVVDYLHAKYGEDRVRSIANVNTFQPKSAIGEFAAGLSISKYETEAVKDAIIERSGGDARAAFCIADTFDTTDVGKQFIDAYPTMKLVTRIEGHASHAGKHAAGIIVSPEPLTNFTGINSREDSVMLDKKDAEALGLLKIDCLGLRTLSILEDVCDAVGMTYDELYRLPLDDQRTFDIFNEMRLSGVFQFEGYALQAITRQMGVHNFYDLAIITSLARPGALNSGGAARYVKYRNGAEEPHYYDDTHRHITSETLGVCIYQEQMMEIARQIGSLSWEDVSELRKAASKSLGDEFFAKYKDGFMEGALQKLAPDEAEKIWNDICHSGSWSFNKSHAVAYSLLSYWTAYFKAHHPLEFSMAVLNNSNDTDSAIKFLRDIVVNDGIEYCPFDPDESDINWSINDGKLLGGLTNVHGIGEKKAAEIKRGKLTPGIVKKLMTATTDFDILFPTQHYFGKMYKDPKSFGLDEAPVEIRTIQEEGDYLFIGKLVRKNLRDLNEYVFLKERGHRIEENNLYLLLTLEDDTDSIICKIHQKNFEELGGREIAESGKEGESWYIVKGYIKGSWRKIEVEAIENLEGYM